MAPSLLDLNYVVLDELDGEIMIPVGEAAPTRTLILLLKLQVLHT